VPSDWPLWRTSSPELLAHYVNVEAARVAVGGDFFASSPTVHDLRTTGRLTDVAQFLYEGLCERNIEYEREPVLMKDPGGYDQPIRPPADVVSGKGTCVDLALLYAGLCIEVRLLPMLVLLQNAVQGVAHTLVVVDAQYSYDQWERPRGWKEKDREKGYIDDTEAANPWSKESGIFWPYVESNRYVTVECTDFAATGIDGRRELRLSFAEARAKAATDLQNMSHVATLDIVRMQKGKGYAAYEPEGAMRRKPKGSAGSRKPPVPGPIVHIDDLQNERWGGLSERDGRKVTATLDEVERDNFYVNLVVSSTDQSPLEGPVIFHLHSTYTRKVRRITDINEDNSATIDALPAYEVFTVGVQVKNHNGDWIGLELDLSNLKDLPKRFL
jgi:hypothetical protein